MIRGKYMKLRNMREDLLDRASAAIAKLYDAIIVDDPNVQGMMHNQPLSRGIRDASFYAFKLKLKWKAEKYGRNMIEIGRFGPSSKLCSQCGNIKHGLKPSDRTYRCDVYGLVIDRDYNASKNIRRMGLIKVGLVRPEFTPVEIATSGLRGLYPYGRMSAFEAGGSGASAEGRLTLCRSLYITRLRVNIVFYKKFGRDGPEVSEVGMGTYYDAGWIVAARLGWLRGGREKIRAIRTGLDGGINLIDTAEIYGSEPLVAEAIAGYDRQKIFLATKVWSNHLHRRALIRSLNRSLERLRTDYVDLYQVHFPSRRVNISETMGAMEDLVDEGKVKFIGVSNFSMDQIIEAKNALRRHGLAAVQLSYSLANRDIEKEILPYCEKEGIMLLAYYPLAHGRLASASAGVQDLARKYGRTPVQMALNWLICRPSVLPIPRASSMEHVTENLGASGWRLSDRDMASLETAFQK